MDIYQFAIRPIFFSGLKVDPEFLHQRSLQVLKWLQDPHYAGINQPIQAWLKQSCCLVDARLEQQLWGLKFPNPIGLAAGFDKNGVAARAWPLLGFGFAELGTVTRHSQPGNPRPRLFRLPLDHAALNRMGFNNHGAAAMAKGLAKLRQLDYSNANHKERRQDPSPAYSIPLGINLGKSKVTPLSDAAADYLASFQLLKTLGDYFVVNVSSPNTPGLRSLQAAERLHPILEGLTQANPEGKPIFVKISPDLSWDAIASTIELAQTYKLAGIIATNTTLQRDRLQTQRLPETGELVTEEAGGISGRPLCQRSTEIIRFIWQQTNGQVPIIGVGGVFSAEDAWEKIAAGASLVQVYTGWIYEGPWMVRRILAGLLQKLEERGLTAIADAVGIDNES